MTLVKKLPLLVWAPEAELNVPVNAINFFNDINRGGLFKPTKKCLMMACFAGGHLPNSLLKSLKNGFWAALTSEVYLKKL